MISLFYPWDIYNTHWSSRARQLGQGAPRNTSHASCSPSILHLHSMSPADGQLSLISGGAQSPLMEGRKWHEHTKTILMGWTFRVKQLGSEFPSSTKYIELWFVCMLWKTIVSFGFLSPHNSALVDWDWQKLNVKFVTVWVWKRMHKINTAHSCGQRAQNFYQLLKLKTTWYPKSSFPISSVHTSKGKSE
jgi:hypothetical protein